MTADMPDPVKIEHALNELCDFATSAIEWLRNIRDEISLPSGALATMEQEWKRVSPLAQAAFANARAMQDAMAGRGGRVKALETAMREACDLLAERTSGSPARSPGHNARLRLEEALSSLEPAGAQEGAQPAGKWDERYRPLKAGEIIAPGDEVLTDSHLGWRKDTHCAGQPAPDPSYTSHRMYRRLIATPAPDVPGLVERLRYRGQRWAAGQTGGDLDNQAADALEALQAEVDDYRRAIVEGEPLPVLKKGNFLEMIRSLHAAQKGGLARATAAEAERDALRAEVERKDKALRDAIEALEAFNECDAYLNPIRAALSPAKAGG